MGGIPKNQDWRKIGYNKFSALYRRWTCLNCWAKQSLTVLIYKITGTSRRLRKKAAAGESTISSHVAKALATIVAQEDQFHEDLTEREMEVLHCIAKGLSNMDIANRLNISEKTVKSHVSNILGKLYLTDRTQAAVYTWREGIAKL
jgi:ATP/maltotriose-dependent transcriptional regulator MalT